jgi:hypothetical protein
VHSGEAGRPPKPPICGAKAIFGTVIAVLILAGSASSGYAATRVVPKTAFQCKKAFKSSVKRAACIKRVAAEKPGASCKHPLQSEYAKDAEHVGSGAKHMPISVEPTDPTPNYLYFIGRHLEPPQVTNYLSISFESDSKVVICEAELKTYEEPNGSIVKRHKLPTGPHGDKPFVIGITEGNFRVNVFGRYAT